MAAIAAVRVASRHARRALRAAGRRVSWRVLGGVLTCVALVIATIAAIGEARRAERLPVEQTTSRVAPPILTATGPAAGPLVPVWRVATGGVPDRVFQGGQVGYGIVDGQLVIASGAGIDVRDTRTGLPRWHYYREGWALAGWAATRSEIAVFFKRSPGSVDGAGLGSGAGASGSADSGGTVSGGTVSGGTGTGGHLLVALDAATGQTLWQSQRDLPAGVEPGSLRWLAGPGVFIAARDAHTIQGASSRTGRTVWSRRLPGTCSLPEPEPYGSAGDGSAAAVFTAECPNGQRVFALDPVNGRVRWSLRTVGAASAAITVQHGVTAVWDGGTLQVLDADGRTLLRRQGDGLCGDTCGIAVTGGRVLLSYAPNGAGQVLQAIDIRSARTWWQRASGAYEAMTDAGGRVYALSASVADGLLPAALDVIDPASGRQTTVPLPLAFRSGVGSRPWLAAGGGLLFAGYPLEFEGAAGGSRVIALRSAPTGPGQMVLGGVPQKDWPDACRLVSGQDLASAAPAARYTPVPNQVDVAGLRLLAACGYRGSEASEYAAEIGVGWVTVTAQQAAALLADVRATYQQTQALPALGDEAYHLGATAGQVVVRVGRVILIVRANENPGMATALARAAARELRRDGF